MNDARRMPKEQRGLAMVRRRQQRDPSSKGRRFIDTSQATVQKHQAPPVYEPRCCASPFGGSSNGVLLILLIPFTPTIPLMPLMNRVRGLRNSPEFRFCAPFPYDWCPLYDLDLPFSGR